MYEKVFKHKSILNNFLFLEYFRRRYPFGSPVFGGQKRELPAYSENRRKNEKCEKLFFRLFSFFRFFLNKYFPQARRLRPQPSKIRAISVIRGSFLFVVQ